VNKAELIQALSAYYDGSKSEAAKALNAVVETITYKTAAGEKVSITGFGVFEKVHRSARMVRNPRTGERKRAKATAVPRFRAGSDLKAYVSGAKKVPRATAKKAAPAKAAAKTPAVSKTAVAARKSVAKKATTTAKRPAGKR
jgi:DNA-binding protein HU-beta